ncbi:MAG: hypothetical protein OEU36_11095 [Gammaproteobacteria bacterium]|nr:hypothetical protein [Gammaproteobacteria bacterium]
MKQTLAILVTAILSHAAAHSFAGQAEIVEASADCERSVCEFTATIRHGDTGWDHYVNRWDVLTPGGEVLGTRVLHHPHVDEQPFTRSLSDVGIPDGAKKVRIRAHDSLHGHGSEEFLLDLKL